MIRDANLILSDQQAITASAASTNIIDLGTDRDLGVSDIDVFVKVDEAFTASGSATLVIELETDSDPAFGSPNVLYATAAIGKASLVAGYQPFKIKLPQVTERYLRGDYTVATGPMTAGKLTLCLVTGRDNWRAYDAVTGV